MLIFLDLETTGLEKEDKICSIGIIAVDCESVSVLYDLVNEGKKIPSKTSSVNNITNEMLKGKAKFKESQSYKFLEQNNNSDTTLIAHNVQFDLEKLSDSGFDFKGDVIDTLRVTKHLIPECEAFSLQFLRYELKLYKDEKDAASKYAIKNELTAHNAISDALFVKLLYDYLLALSSKDEMCELSFKKVLMSKFDFGKYQERYIEEIAMIDRGYLNWMLENIVDLDEDLRYSIEHYIN